MGFYRDRLPSLHNYEKAAEEQKIWDIRQKIQQDLWEKRFNLGAREKQKDRDVQEHNARQTRWGAEDRQRMVIDDAEAAREEKRDYQRDQAARTEQQERTRLQEEIGLYKDTLDYSYSDAAPVTSPGPTKTPYIAPGIGDRIDRIEDDCGLEKKDTGGIYSSEHGGPAGETLSSPSTYGSGGGSGRTGMYGLPTMGWK